MAVHSLVDRRTSAVSHIEVVHTVTAVVDRTLVAAVEDNEFDHTLVIVAAEDKMAFAPSIVAPS